MASLTPSSPSSAKKPRFEVSEGDAQPHANKQDNTSNVNDSGNNTAHVGHVLSNNGGSPSKTHTPAQPEHLRFGYVDYEEVEESEVDKRRHYLLRKPKVKQWFYKGKLFRSAEGRASARIEL